MGDRLTIIGHPEADPARFDRAARNAAVVRVVGRGGVERSVVPPLDADDRAARARSAEILRGVRAHIS